MAFQSYFDQLPFGGTFDNGMPRFPFGGAYGGAASDLPSPVQAPQQQNPAPNYTDPANLPGSEPPGLGNISGFQGPGPDGTGVTLGGGIGGSGLGDAQFAAMGFNPINYGGSYGQGNGGAAGFPSFGLGDNISQKFDSLGNAPHINWGNIGQGAINAAGMLSPAIGGLAGILQGFNLYDAPNSTGNPISDAAFTPGMLQSAVADVANWINRQFGGNYMPYDLGSHAAQEPGMQSMLDNTIQSAMSPPPMSLPPATDQPPWANIDLPIPGTGEFYGGGDFIGTPQPDPFAWGLNAPDIGGAGIFNSIGMTPWGGMGFGGGAGEGGLGRASPNADNNGGWGQ